MKKFFNKFINMLKSKWLINGSKTVILILIMLLVYVGINYFFQKLNLSKIDLTENKIYSLTDESKNKIKDVNKNVNIYFFGFNEEDSYVDLAKQYNKINSNINVKVANISDDTDLYNKYSVDEGNQGVVVECDEKSKILAISDFSSYDYTSGQEIDTAEETLTSSILNIITDKKPRYIFFDRTF